MASEAYDFRLRFWDRFLGSFLNARSSKVTSLRAALRAEFWSHRNSTFWEPQCRPQSFRSLVGLLCAPILVTRFGSRFRVPVSESLCGPQNWTHAQYIYIYTHYVYIQMYMYTYMYMHMHMVKYICIYAYRYICIYVYLYIHI